MLLPQQMLTAHELSLARQAGVHLVTQEQPAYPKLLREIYDPPPALYIQGSLPPDEIAVAVVGERVSAPAKTFP